jgi:leader peptidase (prepilin peptidase)/N-methyltransferase
LIEILTGLLFAACAYSFGYSSVTIWTCIFSALLICLAMIDFDTQLLPDQLVYILLWTGLLANVFGTFTSLTDAVIGAIVGYLVLWSFYWVFKLLTGKEGMGYGDFKLFAALGAWFGWQSLLLIILLSSIAGAIIGIALIALSSKDKNTTIPFGPYLAIAGMINLFYGPQIIQAYMQYMGLA